MPNGVNLDIYKPTRNKKYNELNLCKNEIAIGMVGRLDEQKNPVCFVKNAINTLNKTNKKLRFFLIGDGDYKEKLEYINIK